MQQTRDPAKQHSCHDIMASRTSLSQCLEMYRRLWLGQISRRRIDMFARVVLAFYCCIAVKMCTLYIGSRYCGCETSVRAITLGGARIPGDCPSGTT